VRKAYYGKDPAYSIISEGGGGNVAALNAAQRFPEDYDLVGVMGMSGHWTRLPFGQMWYWQAMHKDAASFIPPSTYPLVHQGALDACDALDGLKDGLIGDVEHCKFDPVVLQCKGEAGPNCLTPAQVEAARKIYQGPVNSKTKKELYSPMYPGSELGWARLSGGNVPWFITEEFFKYYVFQDPNWDYKTRPVDFDNDTALADRPEIQMLNAINPDLTKFFARGGKILMVDGWNDFDVPPKVAIDYYKNVLARVGPKATKESMRFFMVPGGIHTPGTTGAENFNFDAVALLEEWKKTGKAPDVLIVTHYKNGMEVGKRLVCQYPQIAIYKGSGGTEDPASFACK
jgi:feruloyl esterase